MHIFPETGRGSRRRGSRAGTSNHGASRPMITPTNPRSASRVTSAAISPIRRARGLWSAGRPAVSRVRMTRLSIPSTTSMAVSETIPTIASITGNSMRLLQGEPSGRLTSQRPQGEIWYWIGERVHRTLPFLQPGQAGDGPPRWVNSPPFFFFRDACSADGAHEQRRTDQSG